MRNTAHVAERLWQEKYQYEESIFEKLRACSHIYGYLDSRSFDKSINYAGPIETV